MDLGNPIRHKNVQAWFDEYKNVHVCDLGVKRPQK